MDKPIKRAIMREHSTTSASKQSQRAFQPLDKRDERESATPQMPVLKPSSAYGVARCADCGQTGVPETICLICGEQVCSKCIDAHMSQHERRGERTSL